MKKEILKRIEDGLITERKHPTEDLWIYNYTPKCQFDRLWDEYTLMCRGLILDKDGNIVARPFKKFFNLGEYEGSLPDGKFNIYDKLDGSLGILYWVGNDKFIATRGSFESEQAIKGTEILREYEKRVGGIKLDKNKTYLFEIIYPENRIVIDYKDNEDLVLLSIIDTKTGKEEEIYEHSVFFPKVIEIKGVSDITKLKDRQENNKEGYVVVWENGFRLKVKFEEYVRLHRLITGVNERRIWDMMRNDESLNELLERVPDEFYQWVKNIRDNLEKRYANLRDKAKSIKKEATKLEDRKLQAEFIFKQKDGRMLSGIVFAMLDNKDYKSRIWKILKPEATKPFKVEI